MITKIGFEKFKCFSSHQEVDCKHVTLLTGCNGRGKSSVFQSLLLVAQSFQSGKNLNYLCLNGRFTHLGTFADVLNRDAQNSKTFTIFIETDDKEEVAYEIECRKDVSSDRLVGFEHFVVTRKDGSKTDLIGALSGNDTTEDAAIGLTTPAGLGLSGQLRNVYFVSAERQGPTSYFSKRDDINLDPVGSHGEFSINTLYEKKDVIKSRLVEYLSHIMGGAFVSVDSVNDEYISLLLDSIDSSEGYKPINVGFGYSYVLPILITLLIAESGSKIFIENPEAHLHPGAQSRLMEVIIALAKEKDLQLFIETHSDHVINASRIAVKQGKIEHESVGIVHIGRDRDNKPEVLPICMDERGNLTEYPNDFMDEWGNQMMQLL